MRTYEFETQADETVVLRYFRQPVLSDDEHAAVRDTVRERLAAGARTFVFDWRDLRFLSSDGMGFMLSLTTDIRAAGGHATLILAKMPRLERVAQITNLDSAVDIEWAPYAG